MKTFKVMDRSGDSELRFAPTQAKEAEAKFAELLGTHTAYKSSPDGGNQQVRSFKDTDEETLFAPHLQGG